MNSVFFRTGVDDDTRRQLYEGQLFVSCACPSIIARPRDKEQRPAGEAVAP